MATEIIINDGGAPSRILPFIAGETIAAGDYVGMESTGKIGPIDVSGAQGLGVSLTAATTGSVVNVVTGKGVILNTFCSGTIAAGAELTMGLAAGMYLEAATTVQKDLGQVVAIYVDSALTTGDGLSLKKVVFG